MTNRPLPNSLFDWLGLKERFDWQAAPRLGRFWGFIASLVIALLPLFFLAALGAAGAVLFDTIRGVAAGTGSGPNLGAGALIAAMLGAPFVIWGTVLKYQTVRFQKEGHITERISQAVEQLGAEKTVERIGRSVTIFTGEPEHIRYPSEEAIKLADKPRSQLSRKEWEQHYDHEMEDVVEDYFQTVSTWPAERTIIQWQGEEIFHSKSEAIGAEGEWQVFKKTEPNIEVRIGGLLSLERISQDSVAYDKGRDHVRVMEILCAYIRNNAPASEAQDVPGENPANLPKGAPAEEAQAHVQAWRARGGELQNWASALPKPRADIQLALDIIGRRGAEPCAYEAGWRNGNVAKADWPFDKVPDYPEYPPSPEAVTRWQKSFEEWEEKAEAYSGYRLDLRNTNLQGADLHKANLSGARLREARMQGADLRQAQTQGAWLHGAEMQGADLWHAQMQGATLWDAQMQGADLGGAQMQGADLSGAQMQGAWLHRAQMQGAGLTAAQMQGADLFFANLSEARGLTQAQIDSAMGNANTLLPPDLTRPAHWN